MAEEKKDEKRFEREIGGFVLKWEEACKENDNMPWLIIKAMSGQWETRFRGDASVTLMWRRLLEAEGTEDFLHSQLRIMQLVNSTINDPLTEVIITSMLLGNTYLIGKDEKEIAEYNKKRSDIAVELTKLVQGLIPEQMKETPVTDEEKKILNDMRAAKVNEDLQKKEETLASEETRK